MAKKPRMGEDPLSRFKDTTPRPDRPVEIGNSRETQKINEPSRKSPQKLKQPEAGKAKKRKISLNLEWLENLQAEFEDLKKQNQSLLEKVAGIQAAEAQLREKEAEINQLKRKLASFEEKIHSMETLLVSWKPLWWEWWRWCRL
jgi:predicted RNase H-like nuclease (RuvC/YqgF family)